MSNRIVALEAHSIVTACSVRYVLQGDYRTIHAPYNFSVSLGSSFLEQKDSLYYLSTKSLGVINDLEYKNTHICT